MVKYSTREGISGWRRGAAYRRDGQMLMITEVKL